MIPADEGEDRPSQEIARLLQEELQAIEPPTPAREDMLKRIIKRTVRSWREWLNRSRGEPDD